MYLSISCTVPVTSSAVAPSFLYTKTVVPTLRAAKAPASFVGANAPEVSCPVGIASKA